MDVFLQMKDICKSFPGVKALDSVSIDVFRNEVVGLVGENGAGKSTLVKIIVGVYQADSGKTILEGDEIHIQTFREAISYGIGMVFQEQSILPNMMVFENIFIGHEEVFSSFGVLSKKKMIQEAEKVLNDIEVDVSPRAFVHDLSFVQREMVEIARNIWWSNRCSVRTPIIILDEPTTVLEQNDINLLFKRINELKKMITIIYISHRLSEVVEICDRVYILKDGKNAGCFPHSEVSEDLLRSKMVGHEFHGEYYLLSEQRDISKNVVMELQGCSGTDAFKDVSFQLHEGEILSICGTVGSGKEELCRAIYGAARFDSGRILIKEKKASIQSPADAFTCGIGYIPEDRRNEGLILDLPLFENATLPIVQQLRKGIFVDQKEQLSLSVKMINKLNIKTPSAFALCLHLSGGNQQKVVLSKWLLSRVKILIMSHPTRGVDVGAKHEIYAFMREMAQQGMAMIMMGDHFEEDIGLANRIVVMKEGEISGVLDATTSKPTPADLIQYIV